MNRAICLGAKLALRRVVGLSHKQLSARKYAFESFRFAEEINNIPNVRCHSSETHNYKSKFRKESVEDLIRDSQSIKNRGTQKLDPEREVFQLLNDWHDVLFEIPSTEMKLLQRSARSIDDSIRICLSRREESHVVLAKAVEITSTGIYAWGRIASFDPNACSNAEDLHTCLLQAYKELGDDSPLQSFVYKPLVYCWSRAENNPSAAERAHHWLNLIIENPKMELQPAALSAVLRAYARQGKLQQVKSLANAWPELKDSYTYSVLMEAALLSNHPQAQQMASQALEEGVEQCLKKDDAQHVPDLYARYMNLNATNPEICEAALNQLILLQQEHVSLPLVHSRHFVITMTGFAAKGVAKKVEELFRRMERLENEGVSGVSRSYQVCFSILRLALYSSHGRFLWFPFLSQTICIVIRAFSKNRDMEHLQRAEDLLKFVEEMLETRSSDPIGNHAYNIVLDAYSRSTQIVNRRERIESTLQRMNELAKAYSNQSIMPDKVSYACLLRVIIEEGGPDMTDEVESVVRTLEASDVRSHLPDAQIYTMLLDAYDRGSDHTSVDKAEALWDWLGQRYSRGESSVYPDDVMYRLMLKIYANAGKVKQSDSLLFNMMQDYRKGNLKGRPSEEAFLMAMRSWTRSRRPDSIDGALRLFNIMTKEFRDGNVACRSTGKTFSQLMVVLAHNEHPGKLEIANRLLGRMKDYAIEPDRVVLNWYLRVCSSTPPGGEQENAIILEKVFDTLEFLRISDRGADSNSYLSAMLACERRLDGVFLYDQISALFGQCKEAGMVNRKVLAAMHRLLGDYDYRNLTLLEASKYIEDSNVPFSWRAGTNFN
jgi:hypothetical protein